MKTLWIEDVDALNVGRVIVTKTGTKDCTVCYSCDEREDYENRLKADMVAMLDKIRAEIIDEKDFAYANFEQYKEEVLGAEPDELPDDDFRYGMERAIEIINKYTNDKCDKGCDFCEHTSECMPSGNGG